MDALYSIFTQSLQDSQPKKLVLAFSGGVDSRVLLELLSRYQQQHSIACLAVHVHHGLSDNADGWATLCQRWCQQAGVACKIERVQLALEGKSLEECARDARYQALSQHISSGDVLITGQHSDDQLETFLLALKRGSGPKGLSAMAKVMPWEKGTLVRPLLSVSRDEIERFAQQQQLEWVEDESNQDIRFDRNYIRHQIAPAMKQRWPHIQASVQRSAELCAEQEALLDELLTEQLHALLAYDQGLSIDGLAAKSERVRLQLIRMWFANAKLRMPSREHLQRIWQQVALAVGDANPILNLGQVQVRRFSQRLYHVLPVRDVNQWQAALNEEQSLILPDELGLLRLTHSDVGDIDLNKEQLTQLTVTFNPEGLNAHPVSRGHSRKLKKLFQEYGVPSWLRRRTPIIMCESEVVAVMGLFICKDFAGKSYKLDWQTKPH